MPHNLGVAPCLPARFVFGILGIFGLILQYTMKVNLSVAIIAMVKTNDSQEVNSTLTQNLTDVCPIRDSHRHVSKYEGEFYWDNLTKGHVLSFYYYGFVCTQLFGGYMSNRFGGRMVLGLGVLITGIFTVLSPVAARVHEYLFMVCRFLEGAASGVIIPSMNALYANWFPPQERNRFTGIIFASTHLGTVIGMALSGYLADVGGWPLVFYFFGGLSIIWFFPWILLVYDSPELHPRISDKERLYILSGLGRENRTKKKIKAPVPWGSIVTSKPVWAAVFEQFGYTWLLFTLLSELPTYMSTVLHFDLTDSGLLSALPYLFEYFSSIFSGMLSQWVTKQGYLTKLTTYRVFDGIAAIGPSVCFIIISFSGCDYNTILALLIITTTCCGCFMGGSYLNHLDLAVNFAGSIAGILHTIGAIPGFLTPIIVSAITKDDTLSQWNIVFYVSMVCTMIPYIFYLIFGSVEEQPWNKIEEREDNTIIKTDQI